MNRHVQQIGIGIDSFAFHRYFGEIGPWETAITDRWDTTDFLQRANELGAQAVSLQTAYLPSLTPRSARYLRARLDQLGLEPVLAWGHRSGLENGKNPEKIASLRHLLPLAELMTCSLVRIVCGDQFSFQFPAADRIARLTPILRQLAAEAVQYRLTLAIENHADFRMEDLVALVDRVGAANLGICLDTGNVVRVGDELLAATELAGSRIKMVHLKDMILLEVCRGDPTAWWPSAPLGRGHLPLAEFVDCLRSQAFTGHLFIEMANMYTNWPDEDAAVVESVAYLKQLLKEEER